MSNPQPQPVVAPLTRAAIFLVVTLNPGDDHRTECRFLLQEALSPAREDKERKKLVIAPQSHAQLVGVSLAHRRHGVR